MTEHQMLIADLRQQCDEVYAALSNAATEEERYHLIQLLRDLRCQVAYNGEETK